MTVGKRPLPRLARTELDSKDRDAGSAQSVRQKTRTLEFASMGNHFAMEVVPNKTLVGKGITSEGAMGRPYIGTNLSVTRSDGKSDFIPAPIARLMLSGEYGAPPPLQ